MKMEKLRWDVGLGGVVVGRGATTFSKSGVQLLGLEYYYPFTEKIRQVYPVWCSRLHNHNLFIKKLCKKWGVRPNFGEVRTTTPQWLRPWSCGLIEGVRKREMKRRKNMLFGHYFKDIRQRTPQSYCV